MYLTKIKDVALEGLVKGYHAGQSAGNITLNGLAKGYNKVGLEKLVKNIRNQWSELEPHIRHRVKVYSGVGIAFTGIDIGAYYEISELQMPLENRLFIYCAMAVLVLPPYGGALYEFVTGAKKSNTSEAQ